MKDHPDNVDLNNFDSYGNMPESPDRFIETYDPRSNPPTVFTWVLSAVLATILGALWLYPLMLSIYLWFLGVPIVFFAVFVGLPAWGLFRAGRNWPKATVYAIGWLVSPAVAIALFALIMTFVKY